MASSESEEEDLNTFKTKLNKLKDKDPEFYTFLKENDRDLLRFGISDEDKVLKNNIADEKTTEDKEGNKVNVSSSHLRKWKKVLQEQPDVKTIRKVIETFNVAVQHTSGELAATNTSDIAEESSVFNDIIWLCTCDLVPAICKVLKLPSPAISEEERPKFSPAKSRMWKKLMVPIKSYLLSLIQLLNSVSEPSNSVVLIKHVLQLIPFYLVFVRLSRVLLKKMVTLWCTSEESVRILAFLSIFRICRSLPSDYLDYILKQMYTGYVKNCKFTSPTTWPLINFMKHSLVEMYALEQGMVYQHAFIYVRQLVIHLRNALTVKKKDAYQAVYNWQYIHCLLLWIHLLSSVYPSEILKPLVYPVVQTTIGTIRLIPTARYIPLRCHLINALIQLSRTTKIFIPVMPLILEVLDIVDFNKKHTSLSLKPLDLSSALKFSKSQIQLSGFKDCVIEKMYELLVDYLNFQSHHIGFPELVLPAVVQLKGFLKKCRVANCCRQIKQILDKIEENSSYVIDRRKNCSFAVSDIQQVEIWEKQLQEEGTPLSSFYKNWNNIKNKNSVSVLSQKEQRTFIDSLNKSCVMEDQKVSKCDEILSDSTPTTQIDMKQRKKQLSKTNKLCGAKKRKRKFGDSPKRSKQLKCDASQEDIIEELELSSTEEESDNNSNCSLDSINVE